MSYVYLVLCAALILAGCDRCSKRNDDASIATATATGTDVTQPATASATAGATGTGTANATEGVLKDDLTKGTGAEAIHGKKVHVLYSGTLQNGTVFDARRERTNPFVFEIGGGAVIEGFDQGVRGMKVGGVRRVTIPPRLAYGDHAVGGAIPPGSTLIFEIELLKAE